MGYGNAPGVHQAGHRFALSAKAIGGYQLGHTTARINGLTRGYGKCLRRMFSKDRIYSPASWWAKRSKDNSESWFDIAWTPKGMPELCVKSGIEIAGIPVRLA